MERRSVYHGLRRAQACSSDLYSFSRIHLLGRYDKLQTLIEHTPGSSGGCTKAASFFLPARNHENQKTARGLRRKAARASGRFYAFQIRDTKTRCVAHFAPIIEFT